MTDVRITRQAVAVILCVTVWHMCAVASFAREIGPAAPASSQAYSSPLTALLAAGSPGTGSPYRTVVSSQPQAVAGSIGQVSWIRLPSEAGAWACRTATGSVSLDLLQAGKVSILENSNVDIQVVDDGLVVNLVRGSVVLEGTAASRVRVETFDGSYLLGGKESYRARFTWRAGSLAYSGEPGERVARSTGPAVQVSPLSERFQLANGRPGPVGFRVLDMMGKPVPGVPVYLTAVTHGGGKVSFSGSPTATVLTDENGVAEAMATALGSAPVEFGGAVGGTQAAATAPANVDRTTGGQKWMAVIILGAVAAATIALVVWARGQDDPKMSAGTPSRVAP